MQVVVGCAFGWSLPLPVLILLGRVESWPVNTVSGPWSRLHTS